MQSYLLECSLFFHFEAAYLPKLFKNLLDRMAFDVGQVLFFVLLEHHCLELYFHVVYLLFYWNVKVLQDVARVELFGHLFVFLLEVDQLV